MNEALVLLFSQPVTMTSLTIRELGNNDSAVSILNGNDAAISNFSPLLVRNGSPTPDVFDLSAQAGDFTGTRFVLLGNELGGGVRLTSLNVNTAVVPLPAALGFMLLGLAGLGLLGRWRRAA